MSTLWAQRYRLFTYGSLQPGEPFYDGNFAERVPVSLPARVRGRRLRWLDGYPGLMRAQAWASGHLLAFSDASLLAAFDAWEEFVPTLPPRQCPYLRRSIEVYDNGGRYLCLAEVYLCGASKPRRI